MKFIKFLIRTKLYPILLFLIFYVVMFFMGEDVSYGSLTFTVLIIGVIVTLLYSIYCAFLPKKKKDKKDKGNNVEPRQKVKPKKNVYPIYFTVKQDPRYVFAEYEDRYELYLKTESGLKYIKTDAKQ
ncbi:MAG: hypothetical protein IKV61_04805 [Clostridia bacterium]|nr:hypothetical protein [Clostridia bacterium]